MLNRYYPYEYEQSVFSIDYEKLYKKGFRAVIFDIDNTLVHHNDPSTPEVDELFRRIHSIGLKTLLLTNNDEERILYFIKNIDTDYISDADKPEPDNFIRAAEQLGVSINEAVFVGDQVFTDICGANRCGMPSILVHYIEVDGEKWIGWRRYAEKLILLLWRHSKYYKRIGNIHYERKAPEHGTAKA